MAFWRISASEEFDTESSEQWKKGAGGKELCEM